MRELGSQHKLWGLGSNGVGLASKSVLVSSHGVPRLFNSTFTVPAGTVVAFLGAEGVALLDPGFRVAARLQVAPYEIFGPGTQCPDYSLTKWQGYHQHLAGAILGKIAQPFLSQGTETYNDIETFLRNNQSVNRRDDAATDPMDILTIRYRPGRISTTLSETITVLRANGYLYEFIICCFCRGIFGGHDATRNNFWRMIAHE